MQRLGLTGVLLPLTVASIFPFVGSQVVLEQLVLGEGQSTEHADGSCAPAVDLLVPPQRSGSGETLAADIAAVRFDSRVTPHVRFHVLERLHADLTRPAPITVGFSVRSEMVEQSTRGPTVFTTDPTAVLRVARVCFHVLHQIPFVSETLPAVDAAVSCPPVRWRHLPLPPVGAQSCAGPVCLFFTRRAITDPPAVSVVVALSCGGVRGGGAG